MSIWEISSDHLQEGIGGVMKTKVKRKVKTGAYTFDHADERESGKYLERERTRQVRSFCGWCARVIPSTTELGIARLNQLFY
jgi:hypothetical protein